MVRALRASSETLQDDDDLVRTCDETDPRSLLAAMSREAGRCKLPMRVVVEPSLASLAATGDGVIFVAAEQWIRVRDVERTVLHEIAGHALPRARAASAPLGIFAFGTARGIDDQEGRALLIERRRAFSMVRGGASSGSGISERARRSRAPPSSMS